MNGNLKATIIENMIPQFIRDEYPNFVEFIKVYYQSQDIEGEAYNFIANIRDFMDVDRTTLEYLENFSGMYLASFSNTLLPAIDKRTLIKNIRQFYESAGSEKSFKFLFRILFDEDVEIYYPSDDVLRVSDGKWSREQIIKISNNENGEISGLVGTEIVGQTSGAKGLVETVELYEASNGFLVAELSLSTVNPVNDFNNFLVGEMVVGVSLDGLTTIHESVYSIITGIDLITNDIHNQPGDIIEIAVGPGVDGYLVVESVESGGIESIEVIEAGTGYSVNDIVEFISSTGCAAKAYVASVGGSGEILTVGIVSEGHSYKTMPEYNIISSGTGAKLYPVSSTIGKVKKIEIGNAGVNYLGSTSPGFPYQFPLQFEFLENSIIFYDSSFIYNNNWNNINYKINEPITGQYSGAIANIKRLNLNSGILGYKLTDIPYNYTGAWGSGIYAEIQRTHTLEYDWTVWIKTPSVIFENTTIIGSKTSGGFAIRLSDAGKIISYSSGIGNNIISVASLLPDTEYKIRVTGDNTNISIYIDDILDNSDTVVNQYVIGSDIIFGSYNGLSEYWTGLIYRLIFKNSSESILNDWNVLSYASSTQNIIYDIVNYDQAVLFGTTGSFFTISATGIPSEITDNFNSSYDTKTGFIEGEEIIGTVSGASGFNIYKLFNTSGTIIPGAISEYSGYYRNTDGFVSGDKYIQDSYYYQDFSYAITTLEDQENWNGPVQDMLHPAGTIVFGFSGRESAIYGYSDGGWISPRLNTIEFYKFKWDYYTNSDGVNTSYSNTQLSEFKDYPIYTCSELREDVYIPGYTINGESINTLRKTNVCFGSKIRFEFPDNNQGLLIDSLNNLLIDSTHILLI